MNRYWDLTEKERAAASVQQVEAFLVVELMEKGVVKVEPPVFDPVEETKLLKTLYFEIQRKGEYGMTGTGILFTDAEKAQRFIELAPLWEDSRYEYSHDQKYAAPGRELSIKSTELPSEVEVVNMATVLKKNKSAEESNAKKRGEYRKAIESVDKATKGIWDDWHDCRAKAQNYEKVLATFKDYVDLCEGNKSIAEGFLAKAFNAATISEAKAWFGGELYIGG